ncbi:MAG: AAA family ATPase [Candidatus Latescibacter sp.]|nr:AAA family ATPase [Candidatus Latescibacter sp.]
MIDKLVLENFTAFSKLDISFSPGINIFIGENGTGKTHVLKVLYSVLAATQEEKTISTKMVSVFLPDRNWLNGLVKRDNKSVVAKFTVCKNGKELDCEIGSSTFISNHQKEWDEMEKDNAIFIPVKEMLANAPGFNSLYKEREVHFEEVYADIISKALLPKKREITPPYDDLSKKLEKIMGGSIYAKDEQFYLQGNSFDLEFPLLAEGMRKLGLLWILLQNGSLDKGSVLFWDEPEANMNPSLVKIIIEVLLELQRNGVQIFIATHNYIVLKELDIQKKTDDKVRFFSFLRNESDISVQFGGNYLDIVPNKISEAYTEVYNKVVQISLGGNS